MKEKIFEILHNRKRMPGERFSDIEGRVEELVNQEVEKRIKERMPSEEWNYCPYCGMDWVKDSDAFGCWCCGKSRSRLIPQVTPQDTPQEKKSEGGGE